jgi:hypothetical protein
MNAALVFLLWVASMMATGFFAAWLFYTVGYDHAARDMDPDRHRHRRGDPQTAPLELPRSGYLPPLELEGDWRFFGGIALDPPVGAAEYALLTAAVPDDPACETHPASVEDETPSAFTRRQAAEVDRLIAEWEAHTNYQVHLMHDKST